MHVDYQCLFDGKDTSQQCDYGVRACTDYIKLPSKMHAFPPESENVPFGCRWVRKNTFISHLEALGKTAK
jgi:hypothetical protein